MKNRILVVSYFFAPECKIASVRWTKIGKYLARRGWSVDVVTREGYEKMDDLLQKDCDELNVIRLQHGDSRFAVAPKQESAAKPAVLPGGVIGKIKRSRPARWLRKELRIREALWFDYERSLDFAEQFSKAMDDGKIDPRQYDAVVCSFGPASDTLIALEIKRRFPDTRLIMDFRDPMVSANVVGKCRKIYGKLQKQICDKADTIMSVSAGCLKHICSGKHMNKAEVLPNGYDTEDLGRIEKNVGHNQSKYELVCLGALYNGKRDLSPLFAAISKLSSEGIINLDDIVLHYAGKSQGVMLSQAEKYDLSDVVLNHGFISREESLVLQKNARALVLASWNLKGEEGVMTGKFLEYMMMNRPICALISGNLANSELKSVIERGRLGVVYEQPTAEKDFERLCNWLKEDYSRFKNGMDEDFNPDAQVVAEYAYPEIARRFEDIVNLRGKQ